MRFKALVRKFYQRYLLDAMSAMALGLFASLIIGLILTQLSMIPALKFRADYGEIVSASSPVVGAAIGVAIAYGLKVAPLAMFSSAATGASAGRKYRFRKSAVSCAGTLVMSGLSSSALSV